MSTRYNDGSHYENHPKADELQNLGAHAHSVAEHHGKQDHLTAHELSRQAIEESHGTDRHLQARTATGHGIASFGHDEISALAYQLWQARGCPQGSPEEDWFNAAEQLRSRAHTR